MLSRKWHICIKVQGTSWKRDGKNVRVGRKGGCCLPGMTWLCHVGTIACYGDGDTHEALALPQDLRAVNGWWGRERLFSGVATGKVPTLL